MEDNKLSVELELNTSEYRKGIKEAIKDAEKLDETLTKKKEIRTNIDKAKEDIEKYKNLIKETEEEMSRISKKIGKSLNIVPSRDPSKFESFKAIGSDKLSNIKDSVKINFAEEGVEPLKGQEEEFRKLEEIILSAQQRINSLEGTVISLTEELKKIDEVSDNINNHFTGWKDNAYYIDGKLKGVKKEASETENHQKGITDELVKQMKYQSTITKEMTKTTGASKKLRLGSNVFTRLIGRIGMSIRRQITYRIASALNPLNMMKKTFSYLTDTLSPRLGATFKNIGNNFVEYFANSQLFKNLINQLLYVVKLLQDAFNAVAKLFGFRQIDLFKTSTKTAKELEKSASRTVASFDEINDIGNQSNNQDQTPYSLGELDLQDRSDDIINNFNTIIQKLDRFFQDTDFVSLGNSLGEKFSDVFGKIDWESLGSTLMGGLLSVFDIAWGFLEKVDWEKIGKGVSDFLNGAMDRLNKWLDKVDFNKGIDATIDALIDAGKGFDWSRLTSNISKLFGRLLIESLKLINPMTYIKLWLIEKIVNKTKDNEETKEAGENIGNGLLDGIWNTMKNIGKWIYENIFKPMWDGIKSAFGIHSPSTKMMEIGENIIQGLLDGIGDIWNKAKSKFNDFKEKVKIKFEEVKTSIKEKVEGWTNTIKSKFTWDNIKSAFTNIGNKIKEIFSDTGAIGKFFTTKYWKDKFSKITFPKIKMTVTYDTNVSAKKLAAAKLFGLEGWPKVSISSYDVGTNYVPYDQLAYIHQGEAVIPKKFNEKEYFGNSDETNSLLEEIIEKLDNVEFNPYIQVRDIGEASISYINNKSRITGRSVI